MTIKNTNINSFIDIKDPDVYAVIRNDIQVLINKIVDSVGDQDFSVSLTCSSTTPSEQ